MATLNKRLMRNPHRSRLGGVCAGLSDYTGLSQTLFRVLFLISLLFGGFGFWVYLILWVALPARNSIPVNQASLSLRWQLFRLGRHMARIHATQSASLADQAQLAYDAVRRLAPRIDLRRPEALDADTARLALIDFPSLLDQIHRAGPLMIDAAQDERIAALHLSFSNTCDALIEASQETLEPPGGQDVSPPHQVVESFRIRIQDLKAQLSKETSVAVTEQLKHIELHLNQLLAVPESILNDLSPIRAHEIHRIAFDFLPETLDAYLKVQGPLARTEAIRDQKTAEEHLKDQLDLLSQTLDAYSRALLDRDARGLLIQGHFLREKFGSPSLDNKDN